MTATRSYNPIQNLAPKPINPTGQALLTHMFKTATPTPTPNTTTTPYTAQHQHITQHNTSQHITTPTPNTTQHAPTDTTTQEARALSRLLATETIDEKEDEMDMTPHDNTPTRQQHKRPQPISPEKHTTQSRKHRKQNK